MNGSAGRAAFFDVDGTLTRTTTMFDVLRFDAVERGIERQGEAFLDELRRTQTEDGTPRAEANRSYFRWWRHRRVDEVAALVERWADSRPADYFHPSTLARLQMHHAAGDLIVLVSGSVPILLQHLAGALGASVVLATRMTTDGSVFTGEIDDPMIGNRKAAAVAELAEERGLDLQAAAAYGDHDSDAPLLALVGDPIFCSRPGEPACQAAVSRGWATLHLTS
ncbi:HAD family hydrolase [Curtobacterium luteum]|uniref:HAD family hydrolase n=1 Tax=Curtobacterium luteum TaxID=33881 RepID=UPI00381DABE6